MRTRKKCQINGGFPELPTEQGAGEHEASGAEVQAEEDEEVDRQQEYEEYEGGDEQEYEEDDDEGEEEEECTWREVAR